MNKLILLITLSFFSCTIFLPEVHVATQRTAAEKQLIGDFTEGEELGIKDKEFHLFVKPYHIDSNNTQVSNDTIDIYLQKRILIADEIYTFKQAGIIGENSDGMIEVIDEKYLSKRLTKVVAIENSIREVIINDYSHSTNISIEKAKQDLYQYNLYVLLEGEHYETTDGKWKIKSLK